MKLLLKTILVAMTLAFASTVAAEMKIAYVNAAKIFKSSPQVEAAEKKLASDFKSRQSAIQAKSKRLKDLQNKLKKDGAAMSDDERSRLRKDIVSRNRKLKNDKDAFREDLNLARIEVTNKIRKKVLETIRSIGKSEKYDLILMDNVVYVSKKADITEKVLSKLGKK